MRKGISPLVASVLLIAITIAVAAVLANWVTTYTNESLPQTSCVGGQIGMVSNEFPKWTGSTILAVVEGQYVSLSDFKIVVLMNDDSVSTYDDKNELELAAGAIGQIETDPAETSDIDPDKVRSVQILTSCSGVKSGWYDLQIPITP